MKPFDLYESAGFLLINTAFQVKQNLTTLFQSHGYEITIDQFAVLTALHNQDRITQKLLCEKTCKTESNLTRILGGMEKKGLLKRQVGTDARSRIVCLTAASRTLYQELLPLATAYNRQILEAFSVEEQKTLTEMILRVRAHMDIDALVPEDHQV